MLSILLNAVELYDAWQKTEPKKVFFYYFFHKTIQFICLQHMEEKGIGIGMLGF